MKSIGCQEVNGFQIDFQKQKYNSHKATTNLHQNHEHQCQQQQQIINNEQQQQQITSDQLNQNHSKQQHQNTERWTELSIQKLHSLADQFTNQKLKVDFETISKQIGITPQKCKEKLIQLRKNDYFKEQVNQQKFIELIQQSFINGDQDINYGILEEIFMIDAGQLKYFYNQNAHKFFTEQQDQQILDFYESQETFNDFLKPHWRSLQQQLGAPANVIYRRFLLICEKQKIENFFIEKIKKILDENKNNFVEKIKKEMQNLNVRWGIVLRKCISQEEK